MNFVNLFRDFTLKGKAVRYDTETNMVVFDDMSFPKDTESNFKGQNGKFYKLEDIWFVLQHRDKPWLQYVKECNNFKFQIVSFLDHKELLNYLTGKIDSSAKVTAPVAVAPVANTKPSGDASRTQQEASSFFSLGSQAAPPQAPPVAAAAAGVSFDASKKRERDDANFDGDVQHDEDMEMLASQVKRRDAVEEKRLPPKQKEEADAPKKPLTEAEIKVARRKQETVQRDQEEILKLGEAREMKLKEILADEEIVDRIREQERVTVTTEALLRSSTRNFKHILNLMYLRQNEARNLKRGSTAEKARAASSSSKRERSDDKRKSSGEKRSRPGKDLIPIIIVPAAMTSNLTIFNAKDFLEQGQWIPSQRKKDELKGQSAPTAKVGFFHDIVQDDGSETRQMFEIVDNTRGFTSEHWKRVIAVFTNGKDWEFKDWKLGDPTTMFHKVAGFYLGFRGEPAPPAIKNWNVSVLTLDKNARHNDITAQKSFWEVLKKSSSKHPVFATIF